MKAIASTATAGMNTLDKNGNRVFRYVLDYRRTTATVTVILQWKLL